MFSGKALELGAELALGAASGMLDKSPSITSLVNTAIGTAAEIGVTAVSGNPLLGIAAGKTAEKLAEAAEDVAKNLVSKQVVKEAENRLEDLLHISHKP